MKQGQREGRGSITFPEGAIYEGRFRDDRLDGQGTIVVIIRVRCVSQYSYISIDYEHCAGF